MTLSTGPEHPRKQGFLPPLTPASIPTFAFALVAVFTIVDYARPQDVVTPLAIVRPGLLLTVMLAVTVFVYRELVPWTDTRILTYGVLVIVMAAWVPLARNNYWALRIFLNVTQWVLLVVALSTFVNTRSRCRIFVVVWVLACAFQALWALGHEGRGTSGFFGDENDLAMAANLALPFAVFVARDLSRKALRIAFYLIVPVLILGVTSSFSRGGFVGLAMTVLAIVVFGRRRLALLGGLLVFVVGLLLFVPSEYLLEVRSITNPEDPTRLSRLRMWGLAYAVWLDHPIFGVGQGNIAWSIGAYEIFDPETERSYAGMAVHSIYLTLISELGVVGVILFGILIGATIRDCAKLMVGPAASDEGLDRYARAIVCAMIAFLACGLFISTLYYPHFYYLTGLSLALRRLHVSSESSSFVKA